ncbi:hypothetical protein CLAFUW4_03628 [Fulvia fulva]|uniref:Uncharacterized protein n=1 Tax=Passalora fulva TaxID=5499 RepID=A0A9Q8LB82_PASFU|nr:uncharacterized protein CLAFUR5_03606 [Fulvia fulva]KAK4631493.1 hypothetical protein CLAFUR4_03616 [Fulvia fulva]KAK4632530.1 hypothetical protein CLAFUR0_03619 [Fulvia fulva]UJO14300.1 hypothetical protein CLAFUR5_03606 [Fulvia fulva]WPV10437.1 hypothetical protein CLAFUW4_03628 [Fulvia fulva]WPV26232.1 hypothetical protein CLAFUW7_03620 [Fulvia fulva]
MGQALSRLITACQNYAYLKHTPKPHPAEQPDPSGKCHLLSLPPELRNLIYRIVLVSGSPVDMMTLKAASDSDCETGEGKDEHETTNILASAGDPPLAQTCHAIEQETLSIYYGENVFRSEPLDISPSWSTSAYGDRS